MKGFILIMSSLLFWVFSFSQNNNDRYNYYIYSKAITEYLSNHDGIDTITNLVINRRKQDDNIDCESAQESKNDLRLLYAIYRNLVIIKDSTSFADTIFINLACKLDSLNNEKTGCIKNKFDLDFKIKMFSEFKIKWVFRQRKKDNRKTFYKKYPNSFGIIEVSNIAYSNNKKYAVFYIGYQRFGLWGYGCLLLLDLESKNEIIKKQVEIWIS